MVSEQPTKGIIYAKFGSVRDARKAIVELPKLQHGWNAQFLAEADFLDLLRTNDLTVATDADRVLIVTVHYQGPQESFDVGPLVATTQDLLQLHGDIVTAETFHTYFPIVAMRVKFKHPESALEAFKLDGTHHAVCSISSRDT